MHLHKRNCSARRCSETPCRTSHNQTRQAGGLLCIPIVLGSVTSAAATGEAAYLVGYITTSYCFHNKTQPPPPPPADGTPYAPSLPLLTPTLSPVSVSHRPCVAQAMDLCMYRSMAPAVSFRVSLNVSRVPTLKEVLRLI